MAKQYLMITNEDGMKALNSTFRPDLIQFLEVEGMYLNGQNKYQLLATPVVPALTEANIFPASTEQATTQDTPQVQEQAPESADGQ